MKIQGLFYIFVPISVIAENGGRTHPPRTLRLIRWQTASDATEETARLNTCVSTIVSGAQTCKPATLTTALEFVELRHAKYNLTVNHFIINLFEGAETVLFGYPDDLQCNSYKKCQVRGNWGISCYFSE